MNNLSFEPSIQIIIGCMYSGKTTELIRRLTIYHEMDMNVLYINSQKDMRAKTVFSTHNSTIGSIPFTSIKSDVLSEIDVSSYEVIGVDEGQLFSGLKEQILDWVENKNKIVIISGLNGDYRRKSFGEVIDLIPYCDSVVKLTPFCLTCRKEKNVIKKAHFTKRIVKEDTTVLIGGKETYIPVCRKCYP